MDKPRIFKKGPSFSRTAMIYGIHPILEALRNGKNVDKILLKKGMAKGPARELLDLANLMEIPVQEVPIEKLNRTTQSNHQGAIAFMSEVEYQQIENIIPYLFEAGKSPFILVLDRITDVRNFGAICRSAACAGVDAILVPSRGAAQVNEDAVKTSAGAIHTLAICRSYRLKESLQFMHDSGVRLIGITEKTEMPYFKASFHEPVALIMGSEEDGISPEYLRMCDDRVQIPMYGNIGSLNVSVAAGIVLFEAARQRNT